MLKLELSISMSDVPFLSALITCFFFLLWLLCLSEKSLAGIPWLWHHFLQNLNILVRDVQSLRSYGMSHCIKRMYCNDFGFVVQIISQRTAAYRMSNILGVAYFQEDSSFHWSIQAGMLKKQVSADVVSHKFKQVKNIEFSFSQCLHLGLQQRMWPK